MTKKNEVRCNNCGWEGYENDLKLFTDLSDNDVSHDVHYFKGCPECKTDEYLMDIEDNINTMRIINIVETSDFEVVGVKSFPIQENQLLDDVIDKVRKVFTQLLRENDNTIEVEDIEEYFESNIYSDTDGYEVKILWSEVH